MVTLTNPFDRGHAEAVEYDAWYDSADGRGALTAELRCLRDLLAGAIHPWLDLGTGTGRFGRSLGADVGLDPAPAMLRLAADRLPTAVRGVAEALPFRTGSVGAVFSVAVFEFLDSPRAAMEEITRVLAPGGRFVLGFFPVTGPWARVYAVHGRDPQSVFHAARFFSVEELRGLAKRAGLDVLGGRTALFEPPAERPTGKVASVADDAAGFAAISFTKPH